MSHKRKTLLGALWVATLVMLPGATIASTPMEPMHVGDATFISGGVGMRERARLFEEVAGYDLLVSFANRETGAFLTGVEVTLQREHHSSIDITANGPYLFAKLPPGHYTLTAALPGWQTRTREVDVVTGQRPRLYVTFVPETQ